MWDVWEEPDRPGEFFILLYESNVATYPWGATYLQGGEEQVSPTATEVLTDGIINQVTGVWLATDELRAGTNYWLVGGDPYTTGSFAGRLITLGTALPAPGTEVLVDYGCIDPSTAQLLLDITEENSPPGTYWPFYLSDYGALLTEAGILDIIRAMGCLPVVSTCVLGPAVSPPLGDEEELPVLASGVSFSRPSADVVRLTPVGVEDKAYIWCHDGAGDWVKVEVDANLDCDLSTTGAGGLQTGDTYSANNGYQIALIAKGDLPAGARAPALIAMANGADDSPVLPAGYTHWSRVISFASSVTGPDLLDFRQVGERYQYVGASTGPIAELEYKGTADSNTDLSTWVPYYADQIDLHIGAVMNDVASRQGQLDEKNGQAKWIQTMSGDVTLPEASRADITVPMPHVRGVQPEVDAHWNTTVTGGGITIIVEGFKIFLG
jgi:hypothetical protein